MKKDFVSLAEARPDLAKEWNYEKNGDLKPEDVSCGSGKKVWWKLPYDVPDDYPVESLRGKHFEFEWEASIKDRNSKNLGCPFLSGKAVLEGFNDLATVRPDLAKQWHSIKNGSLKPQNVTANCGRKVWWYLSYDVPMDYPVESLRGKHFDFEWMALISDRNNKNLGCPFFSGQSVWEGFNDLATVRPDLAKQWHSIKNGSLKPQNVTANCGRKVWWYLSYDVPMDYPVESLRGKHFDFEWMATINSRYRGNSCPYLSGQSIWEGFNDLATVRPDLAKQWHPTRNDGLKPTRIAIGSHKKVWWYLPYDVPMDYPVESLRGKHFDFEWQAGIKERARGNDCPFLSGRAVWKGFNDLATVRPDLAKQWHPILNKELTPNNVIAGTSKKVWWYLPYDVPMDYPVESLKGKHFEFEWQVSIKERNDKNLGCPFLSGRAIWKGFNDLATVSPELAKQWHQIKNNKLTPQDVTISSKRKVWWYLPYDVPMDYPVESLRGKHFDFEWKSTIDGRYRYNIDCPFLSGHDVWRGFNDLQTINPELAAQWHPIKNGDLNPTQVTINSGKKVWWYLPYDVPMDYPVESLRGKHFDFEWQAKIASRYRGNDCPFLTGRGVWKGFNDLQTVNPELAKQWHLTKNGNLKPTQFTANSHKEIWWLFPYDDIKTGKHFNFEWKTTINNRSRRDGCPYLTTYKGEEYIKQYLQKNNISFNTQQKFFDLLGSGDGQLSYDFSIPDEKYGHILIEYNGIQHYEVVEYFGGEEKFKIQKEHDKRKRNYAKKHGYKLITVKYTYDTYESVEEYLDNELKKLGVINDSVNLCSPSPDVDGVSGSPYTSSNHQTDGQPKIGHGFPSIDDTKKEESVNDAA